MATLVNEPGATEFFSYISRDLDADISFEEISYESMPHNCRNMTIKDLKIRQETGTNIIAYKPPEGNYIVNPSPDIALKPHTSFIVLGNRHQLAALKDYLERLNNL
jgi:voltage-gated potassium channel